MRVFLITLLFSAFWVVGALAQEPAGAEGVEKQEIQAESGADEGAASDAAPKAASADFRVCDTGAGRETSGAYLQRTARCAFGTSVYPMDQKRVAIIEDIYIKSWSFSLLNKVFFWLSIVLAVVVVLWPAMSAIFKPNALAEPPATAPAADPAAVPATQPAPPKRTLSDRLAVFFGATAVQTSVTALAALSFAFYTHYKGKQADSERLMRLVLYAPELTRPLVDEVIAEAAKMDLGVNFSAATQPATAANGE